MMMGKKPKAIISDEEKALHSSLLELKADGEFVGQHYYDVFHILRNIRKKLEVKEHISLFSRLAKANNESEFVKYF